MKNILMTLVLSLLFVFTTQAQEIRVLDADTVSNSEYKISTFDLTKIGTYDSIKVGVVAVGEIDLDSLRIQGGFKTIVPTIRGEDKDTVINVFEALETNVLTINNADGAATIVEEAAALTFKDGEGYTQFRFFVWAAAAGTDATDQTQMYIVYLTIFRPVQYNKDL